MKKKSKTNKKTTVNEGQKSSEVPVLYQNLNGELYAFTEVEGQIFWGKVAQSAKTDEQAQEPVAPEQDFQESA